MKDIPTPISDGIWNKHSGEGDDYSYELYEALQLMEQRLALAVAALKEIADYQCIKPPDETAKEALAQILEDETLGGLRGELLLRRCIEICQEESTDNGTAQKIEARIRALKVEK